MTETLTDSSLSGRHLKLVFVDLDGTIIAPDGFPFPGVSEALADLRETGIIIILATGRMLCSALNYVSSLNLSSPVIAYNGAVIAERDSGKWLVHHPLAADLAAEVIRAAEAMNTLIMCFIDDTLMVNRYDKEVTLYEQRSSVTARVLPSLAEEITAPPSKLLIIESSRGKLDNLEMRLDRCFGSRLHMARSRDHYLEVLAEGVNKGSAGRWVCDYLGVDFGETCAFGDNMNDFELLRDSGIGVAVQGAPERLLEVAGIIASSPRQGGMARALRRMTSLHL